MRIVVRRAGLRLALLVFVSLAAAPTLGAQRQRAADPPAKPARGNTTVRAELAAVLLQTKKYDDAAREYRALLVHDAANAEYRLGLAQALAWGGHPRDAEREMRSLPSVRLAQLTVDSLLRAVREAMEPTASEAQRWVKERPYYAPYRLALARALAKQHLGRLAAAQYDTLLSRGVAEPLMLRREQLSAYLDAGDSVAAIASMRDVLRASPSDTALRHELAVLSIGTSKGEARAHYDTLLMATPTAMLFAERARLRFDMGDRAGGEADLMASERLGSTVATYLMLGNLYRERKDYASARTMYRAALQRADLEHGTRPSVRAAIAQIEREERPVAAFAPSVGEDPGWRFGTDAVRDNLGVYYESSTLSRTVALGDAARAGVAVVHQYLGEHSPDNSVDHNAVGVEGSLAGQVAYGAFLGRLGVTGGSLRLPSARPLPIGSATAAVWFDAWEVSVQKSTGPAYPSLLTAAALTATDGDADVLTEQSVTETFGGPAGRADFAVSAQQSRLSDGNRRVSAQGFLRFPLSLGVNVVYVGNAIKFSARSERYWDPLDYTSHAVGLEVASRATRGLSLAVRGLPGVAWSSELLPQPGTRSRVLQIQHRTGFQVGGSGELVWRDPRWEGVALLNYGRGRVGYYRSFGATLGFRVLE